MNTMDVKKRKASAFGAFRKFMCITGGMICFAISICLFLTIVGIPFAIILFMGSFAIIGSATGKYHVKCPNCKKHHFIIEDQEQIKCPKCKTNTLINWID